MLLSQISTLLPYMQKDEMFLISPLTKLVSTIEDDGSRIGEGDSDENMFIFSPSSSHIYSLFSLQTTYFDVYVANDIAEDTFPAITLLPDCEKLFGVVFAKVYFVIIVLEVSSDLCKTDTTLLLVTDISAIFVKL